MLCLQRFKTLTMNTEDKIIPEELIKLGFVCVDFCGFYALYNLWIDRIPQMFYVTIFPENSPIRVIMGYNNINTSLSEIKQLIQTFKTEEMPRKKLPEGEKKKQLRIHVKEKIVENAGGEEKAVQFAETCLESNFGKKPSYKQRKK